MQENTNQFTDFSASENGFGSIQNQSLDKCEQISQFKAHENGFGCVQNQPCRKMHANQMTDGYVHFSKKFPGQMKTNQSILVGLEMVLDASKTNP
jgi:hypothetical protein